ncbi:MAG TPA: DUF6252 family protein [bacterium]|nr:DUF6252 family protein [bacterium]HPN42972.1 DUF6252 family protein [bacterium]
MKKVTRAIILLMSLAMLFSLGCGDDDDDNGNKIVNPGGTTTTNSMKATISGKYSVNFNASIVVALKVNSVSALTITATQPVSGTNYSISLSLNVTQGTGTFPVGEDYTGVNDGTAMFNKTVDNETEMFYANTGSVTITEMGTRIKGTFQFTATNLDGETVTIASGSFNAALSTQE